MKLKSIETCFLRNCSVDRRVGDNEPFSSSSLTDCIYTHNKQTFLCTEASAMPEDTSSVWPPALLSDKTKAGHRFLPFYRLSPVVLTLLDS